MLVVFQGVLFAQLSCLFKKCVKIYVNSRAQPEKHLGSFGSGGFH